MLIGVSLLAVAFVGLLAFYVSATGTLPFTFIDGPKGIPPWAPLLVLLAITFGAVLVPVVLGRFGPAEPTFRDQTAANTRNSLFLTVALVGGVATTSYVLFTVVSLRTSVGLLAVLLVVAAGVVGAVVAYVAWRQDRAVGVRRPGAGRRRAAGASGHRQRARGRREPAAAPPLSHR